MIDFPHRILVTGGAGFIGSNLVEALLAKSCEVVVLDNFLTGKRENLVPFMANPALTVIEGDIRDFEMCRKAAEGCDAVLHEAALGSVPRSIENPQTTLEINAQGFINVIEAARQTGVKRFVYASSSSVYGDDRHFPKIESETGRALSPYALSKKMNEATARYFEEFYGISTVGLRYFNVFGRRQNPAGPYAAIIPKFVQQLLKHESPTVHGDGSHSRDFTYVDNVVKANLLALTTPHTGEIFNIACGMQTTINELVTYLKEDLSELDPAVKTVEVIHGPERAGDIPHSLASIAKAEKLLGYEAETDVQTGLKSAVQWYWKNLK